MVHGVFAIGAENFYWQWWCCIDDKYCV